MDSGLKAAINRAGGIDEFARLLGITASAVSQWKQVPAERALQIELITGIPRDKLRPDLFVRWSDHREVVEFWWNWIRFRARIGRDPDGKLREIVLQSDKPGSQLDTVARDGAIMVSLLLKEGIPLDTIRSSLTRDEQGLPTSAIATALDHLAEQELA
jgi:DNA-binding transcriptional regulator YdaS (Cro superfamily)